MKDTEIIELFFSRSQDAIKETDAKYGSLLKKVSANILHNQEDCEEAIADTYLALWSCIPPKNPQYLRAFTVGILRNICLMRLRSAKKERDRENVIIDELEEVISDGCSIEDDLLSKELLCEINNFLSQLSDDERRIFVSRYYLFAPANQIAAKLGCTESKVYTSLSRTRKKLKIYLERVGLI